jgi:CRP-like cAMP-binding protein/class 3 adenylate cyclase
MAQKIFVTDAQVKAARMLVERDRELGRKTDEATRLIADQELEDDPQQLRRRPDPGTSFWAALDARQRDQLVAAGTWRTFPPGTVLMREGEPGDHVIVILAGRAKVSVNRDGQERVLAVREVGDLIGERAALDVSVRSATVTAVLEMIWALVVQTKDFAAFAEKNPPVMNMVQEQLRKRRIEGPLASEPSGGGWRRLLGKPARARPAAEYDAPQLAQNRPAAVPGEKYTVLLSDIVGSITRTGSDRAIVRSALQAMMTAALHGFDSRTEDRGDGFLTILPSAVPTGEIMQRVLVELPAALQQHNRDQGDSLQLRVAVNVGPVSADGGGVPGEAVRIADRLLDNKDFIETMNGRGEGTSLGIIISPFVYETVVHPNQDLTEVTSYTTVPVKIMYSNTTAWVRWFSPDQVSA